MNTTLTWKTNTGKFASGETAYCGKWPVFSTCWDSIISRDAEKKIKLYCKLPGLKTDLGNFIDWNDAKKKADYTIEYWLEGLENTEGEK